MKKYVYAALAALVLTIGFTSCKDKVEKAINDAVDNAVETAEDIVASPVDMTPEEKAIASFEDLLAFMKGIKVETMADIAKSNEELEGFKTTLEKKYGSDFIEGDFSSLHFTDEQMKRLEELETELANEAMRLANEQMSVQK